MDKFTINKVVGIYTESFDKKPLVSQYGKPYKNCKVTFAETGEKVVKVVKWDNVDVKVGDTFMGKVVEKEFRGKKYSELEIPKKDELQATEIAQIKFALAKHDVEIKRLAEYIKLHSEGKLPSDFSAERVDARKRELDAITPDEIPY